MQQQISYPEDLELMKHAQEWPYGSTHSHDKILKIIQFTQINGEYYRIMSKVRENLIEKGKVLVTLTGKGYKILTPDEVFEYSSKIAKKACKQSIRAYEALKNTPIELMSKENQTNVTHVLKKFSHHNAVLGDICTEVKLLVRPTLNIKND